MKRQPCLKYCRIVLALLLSIALYGCNKRPDGISVECHSFAGRNVIGLVKGKNYIVSFKKERCQYVYNKKRISIRFQDDEQNSYVSVQLETLEGVKPAVVNEVVNVELVYRVSVHDDECREILPMTLLKEEDEICWLWNEEKKIGVIADLGAL